MRRVISTKRFEKDYLKLKYSGRRNMQKLQEVMLLLGDGHKLDPIYKDHSLQGEWSEFRDCHIEGDWILIYKIEQTGKNEVITFHATGSHSSLFK